MRTHINDGGCDSDNDDESDVVVVVFWLSGGGVVHNSVYTPDDPLNDKTETVAPRGGCTCFMP